jgi:hypothetical protein
MKRPKSDLEIIEDFSRHFCIVCKRRIAVVCGTPVIHIGGCCVGIEHEAKNTMYVRTLKCHLHCYVEAKAKSKQKRLKENKVKLMWKFEEVKYIIDNCKVT